MAVRPSRWAVFAAAAATALVGVLLLREPIGRAVFPDAALAGLLSQAERALASDDLALAAARFEAAQARAPDHPRVVEGLTATGERALEAAAQALDRGATVEAEASLALASRLGAPGERIETLRQALLAREEPSVEALLRRATELESSDPDAALALYRQALQREPDNALALAGRSRHLSSTLARATAALDAGDPGTAMALVAAVRAIDPAHLQLPELEARLGASGWSGADEGVPMAIPGVAESAEAIRWRGLADEAIGRGAFDDARRALAEAERLAPQAAELAALRQRLQRAEAARPETR